MKPITMLKNRMGLSIGRVTLKKERVGVAPSKSAAS